MYCSTSLTHDDYIQTVVLMWE